MASTSLGTLTLDMVAKTASFNAGMTKAERTARRANAEIRSQFDKSQKQIASSLKLMRATVLTAFAAITTSRLSESVRSVIDEMDEMHKTASRIGVDTEQLAGLKLAFDLGGASAQDMQMSMQYLARDIQGNNKAFSDLGISITDANGRIKTSRELLGEVADAFAKMPDGANKTAIAMQLFGRSGSNIIPVLNGGSEAFDEIDARARAFGITLDQETAEKAEHFNDQLTLLSAKVSGVKQQFVIGLLPALGRVADELIATGDAADVAKSAGETLGSGIETIVQNTDTLKIAAEGLALVLGGRLASKILPSLNLQMIATAVGTQRLQLHLAKMEGVSAGAAVGLTVLRNSLLTTRAAAAALLTTVGGPVGLLVILGSLAAQYLVTSDNTDKQTKALYDQQESVKELVKRYKDLDAVQKTALQNQLASTADSYKQQIQDIVSQVDDIRITIPFQRRGNPNNRAMLQQLRDLKQAFADLSTGAITASQFMAQLNQSDLIPKAKRDQVLDAANSMQDLSQKIGDVNAKEQALSAQGIAKIGDAAKDATDKVANLLGALSMTQQNSAVDAQVRAGLAQKGWNSYAISNYLQLIQKVRSAGEDISSIPDADIKKAKEYGDAQYAAVQALRSSTTAHHAATRASNAHTKQLDKEKEALKAAREATQRIKQDQDAYSNLVASLRTPDEQRLATLKEQLAVIQKMQAQRDNGIKGAAPQDEINETRSRAIDKAIGTSEMPGNAAIQQNIGSSPLAGVMNVEEQKKALEDWAKDRHKLLDDMYKQNTLSQANYNAKTLQLEQDLATQRQQLAYASQGALLSAGADTFGQLTSFAETYAGKNSGIYRAMFAVEKAFAIARAAVAIQAGIAQAAANPWPANLAAMASVAAATASIIANISSVAAPTGQAHDGIDSVKETGTWYLQKGERVTTAQTSAKLDNTLSQIQRNQSQKAGGSTKVNVINSIDPSMMSSYLSTDAGAKNVWNIIKSNPTRLKQVVQS